MSFIFGGDTGLTWEQAQAKRKLAEELARTNMSTPRNVGEGLNALGRALAYRGITKKAGEAENRLRGDANAAFDSIFGIGGFNPTTSTSGPGAGATTPSVVRPEAADAYRAMNPTTTGDATLGLIRDFEGFRETPYWDVNAYRTGYGSDTITTADGRVVPVTQGVRVTREDAERDLLRRVNSEFMPSARSAVGPEVFDAMDPNQQAALVSLAYNYGANAWGDDLAGVAAAARSGDPAATAQAIRALGSHNGGINANRRAREAALFTGSGQPAPAGPAPTMSAQGQPPASMELAMRLAQLAGNPALDPGRRAMVNALLGQTMQAMQPQSEAERLDLELKRLELDRARNPQPEFNVLTDEQEAALGLPTEGTYQRGADGRITAIGGGGTTNNINMPIGPEALGTQGLILVPDPTADGGFRVVVAEGSPLAQEQAADAEAAAKAEETKGISTRIVLDEIDLARELIQGQSTFNPTTGMSGAALARIDSTDAGSLKNRLMTIKANIGFDKLQAMRDASPTGGALGQVSEFENRLLQAVFGSLEQSQRSDDLLYNLNRLESIYNRVINEGIPDDEARQLYLEIERRGRAPAPAGPAPASPAAGQPAPAAPASIPEADARRALQGLVMSPNFDLTAWEQMPLEAQQRAIRRWLEQNP